MRAQHENWVDALDAEVEAIQKPLWGGRQDKANYRSPRAYTFARGDRQFDFGTGESAALAAKMEADVYVDNLPQNAGTDMATFSAAVCPKVKGGKVQGSKRQDLVIDHLGAPGQYDYTHLYAIGKCKNRFMMPKGKRPAAEHDKSDTLDALHPKPVDRKIQPKIPRTPRFPQAADGENARLRALSARDRRRGAREHDGRSVSPSSRPVTPVRSGQKLTPSDPLAPRIPSAPSHARPTGNVRPRFDSAAASASPRHSSSRQVKAPDDAIRRHVPGSCFGAPRLGKLDRVGAAVLLHHESRKPGPGQYKIKSTFSPRYEIKSHRGCFFAKIF